MQLFQSTAEAHTDLYVQTLCAVLPTTAMGAGHDSWHFNSDRCILQDMRDHTLKLHELSRAQTTLAVEVTSLLAPKP